MFKFNFNEEHCEAEDKAEHELDWFDAVEIHAKRDNEIDFSTSEIPDLDVELKFIKSKDVLDKVLSKSESNAVLSAESNHSDLIPAVYEGGLKIWECTLDLLKYMCERKMDFSGKKVLDLGCGAGLLGIYALKKGAEAHFQDYNSEVIEHITARNVFANFDDPPSAQFYAGDWDKFRTLVEDVKYDIILTSETIYNTDNSHKLVNIFKHCLNKGGEILLAAKTCYFGVGGGTRMFEQELEKERVFVFSVVWKCTEGVNREIVSIKLK